MKLAKGSLEMALDEIAPAHEKADTEARLLATINVPSCSLLNPLIPEEEDDRGERKY